MLARWKLSGRIWCIMFQNTNFSYFESNSSVCAGSWERWWLRSEKYGGHRSPDRPPAAQDKTNKVAGRAGRAGRAGGAPERLIIF